MRAPDGVSLGNQVETRATLKRARTGQESAAGLIGVAGEIDPASVATADRSAVTVTEPLEMGLDRRRAPGRSLIGYITFDKDKLDAKVNELLREPMGLKILRMSLGDDD